ncbi:MAG: exonuclease domain-containing protein [Eubacteriales bacterium]|nr:exonuclease domain-containing protein [Eubacteriales bacterium]MDD3881949.1 exonuclease domain-containing protein [Eubacteriales bacterium]MDD4513150.1 exonuclease domain-containing protein [Eubacteriales bacterium]
MDFILFDLEWNQPVSYHSSAYHEIGRKLLFEIIQIGAVRVDAELNVLDTLLLDVKPQYYKRLHPKVREMTHITQESMENGLPFDEAMKLFFDFIGKDSALVTWGCDDVSVLVQNMACYDYPEKLPPVYDAQRMFSEQEGLNKSRKSLKDAMEMIGIEQEESREFHNALCDAYYTARVFVEMKEPYAITGYEQKPKVLLHSDNAKRTEPVSFSAETDIFASEQVKTVVCPVCGKKIPVTMGYFSQGSGKYIAMAKCQTHGEMAVRAKVTHPEGHKIYMYRNVKAPSGEEAAYIHTKEYMLSAGNAE